MVVSGGRTAPAATSSAMRSRCGRSRPTLGRSATTSRAVRLRRLRPGGDERGAAARLQHGERSLRDVAADRVEDRIAILDDLGEVDGVVVDDLVGADLAQVVVVGCARGGDDARAEMLCQLDGEARNPARASLDQDRLTRFELQGILDRANGRQPRERHGCGIDVRERGGLLGDDRCLDRNLLGIGAFLADVANREHVVADTDIGHALPRPPKRSPEKSRPRMWGKCASCPGFAVTDFPVRAVDACGDDIDHDLARLGHGIRHVAEFQNVRPAVAVHGNGFHR